ncbi:MAG: hypothetical protein DRP01_00130 [Archaeoglobales archaeon]|nr:MAG: hypothetical protein DRP01_00130 [Archaeoglobales archaeon]
MVQGSSSVPPGAKRSSTSLYRDSLKDKANKEWVEVIVEALKEDIVETKKIAISGKRKADQPHSCLHEDDIKGLAKAVNGWKTLKFGAAIGFVVILAGAIAQYYALTDKTEDTAQDVKQVTESVEIIKGEVQAVAGAMDEHLEQYEEQKRTADIEKAVELQAISDIVRAAIEETSSRRRPK